MKSGISDVALSPLIENFKFFLAHLPFNAQPQDVRDYFSRFGTVNFVKLVYDGTTGSSKGFGFLYMNDAQSDAAVEQYATEQQNRITFMDKPGVFLARNDQKRQNPIRNPRKKSHNDGVIVVGSPPNVAAPFRAGTYTQPTSTNFDQQPVNFPAFQSFPQADPYSQPQQNIDPYSQPQQNIDPYSQPQQNVDPYSQLQQNVLQPPASQNFSYQVPLVPNVHALPPAPYQLNQMNFAANNNRKVFLENLPLGVNPDTVSAELSRYSLSVAVCIMEYDNDPRSSWCYAHIDFVSDEEASRCVSLAQQSLLELFGRIVAASMDTASQPSNINRDNGMYPPQGIIPIQTNYSQPNPQMNFPAYAPQGNMPPLSYQTYAMPPQTTGPPQNFSQPRRPHGQPYKANVRPRKHSHHHNGTSPGYYKAGKPRTQNNNARRGRKN